MTETEWLACEDPKPMLLAIMDSSSGRKLRLFAVACCRRVVHCFTEKEQREAEDRLTTAERYADGLVDEEQLRRAQSFFLCGGGIPLVDFGHDAAKDDPRAAAGFAQARCWAVAEMGMTKPRQPRPGFLTRLRNHFRRPAAPVWLPTVRPETLAEQTAQTALLHDIFGNPFRPVAFDPVWRTDTALALARQMYETRDFTTMPILADALQDAGCNNTDILDHCRGLGPHVRGCFVVDLVLGKA
jgi:hypothetical protein